MRKTRSFMLAALLAWAVNAPVLAANGDGWDLDNVKPKAPASQAGQQPRRNPAMEARFRARGDTQRLILGAIKLEKDKKLAITKAQAVKLKPLIAVIQRNDLLNLKNPPANLGRMGQGSTQGFGGPDDKSMQELADNLTKIEKAMNSKQLGAIDAMDFPDLGGRFGGGGFRDGGGFVDIDPKQLEKLRKEMGERQVKQAQVLTKGLKDLIALLEKRSK